MPPLAGTIVDANGSIGNVWRIQGKRDGNGTIHGIKVAYTTNLDCFANFLEIMKRTGEKKARDVRTTE